MRAAVGLILVLIPACYLGPRVGIIVDIAGSRTPEALWDLLAMRRIGVPIGIPAAISFFGGLALFASAFRQHNQPNHYRKRRRPTR